jgi:hypothetical protein
MADLTFTMTAGLLVRGQVKREIQKYCWENDIILQTEEAKGLFESVLHFRLTAADMVLVEASRNLKRWIRENNG